MRRDVRSSSIKAAAAAAGPVVAPAKALADLLNPITDRSRSYSAGIITHMSELPSLPDGCETPRTHSSQTAG